MTYNELINRFEVFDNPPYKKGFERHHIVPICEQKKLYGSVTDNRQIYVSLTMHMWLHILYDREHGTHTAQQFLSICGKPIEHFDCWEKVLAYSYTLRKKKEEQLKKSAEVLRTPESRQKRSDSMKGTLRSEETKQKIADSMKGNTYIKGRHHYNNGVKSIMAYDCPKGFVLGRLKAISEKHSEVIIGRVWSNDGIRNYFDYEIKEGCVPGMIKRSTR